MLLRDLGHPEKAEPLFRGAIAIGEKILGGDHPDVATRLSNLACLLRDTGRGHEAEPLFHRAIAIGETTLGLEHPLRVAAVPEQARTHSKRQIRQIANSIKKFGFCNPILIDDVKQIIAGHGRVEAAKLLGIDAVPTCRLSHLSEADKRAYILADNRLAEKAGRDKELLAIELQGLIDLNVDLELTGFEMPEIDVLLEEAREANGASSGPEDHVPQYPSGSVVLQLPPAGAITFSGTFSGTLVGARSGAGAGAGVWAGFGTVSGMSIGVEPG
jgi:hypothetical protein